ncbi:MAG: hypothetical protein A2283_00790 [Lentisphaerae bacterium RIFOXYA12_FULL_48_11]|nr:MAG: hypothetical protein A2283_00790 [Lentisphaerae bacterium RIFOXYA12_FULL_48_11]
MNRPMFEIGANGIDVGNVVAEIQATVAEKMKNGMYVDARIARAERTNIANLKNDEDFLAFYLECLRDAVAVDINDFVIHEKRALFSKLLVALKKVIWKLLKFYTYRLWSQQNQTNTLLLSAVESLEERYREKIRNLEERIARLESKDACK